MGRSDRGGGSTPKSLIAGIRAYVDDTYRQPERRRDVGCPLPLAFVLLGERFGGWPWEIENAPADRLAYYLAVIGAEGEAHGDHAGMEPGEEVYRME